MEKVEQTRIVNDLVDELRNQLLRNLPDVPANWEDPELRAWLKVTASERIANLPKQIFPVERRWCINPVTDKLKACRGSGSGTL